eukprot:CAMPEP_0177789042 /NCGR_PEP_ID=MMETSP0491_2-20121128/22498_1 /TAXON_ID=63592 /ORGANISM="Tetraselmis chuii, Strain PLY429" /LENGTH=31 /DNA_ID= /DNA_START= /DNA_END= /DNA_ORIENTATION=
MSGNFAIISGDEDNWLQKRANWQTHNLARKP